MLHMAQSTQLPNRPNPATEPSGNVRLPSTAHLDARAFISKVPEVTVWFWVIKVLCTTVGESFADWVSVDLGVGLINTSIIFTVVLAGVLTWQMRLPKYHPFPYWLTVVTLSVTGTLYTDILTDRYAVPLALTTTVFAAALAVVFTIWYRQEGTLSIHHIDTRSREAFYWLAILVTFALGTAAGDWTLELTGWSPGVSVMLPTLLIASIFVGSRLGANPVLSFWLAYILTRPLGANLGDWLALPSNEGGLDLGTAVTSGIFLAAILATVTYLAVKRPDVYDGSQPAKASTTAPSPQRERVMLYYYGVVALVAVTVLSVAHSRPHRQVSAEESSGPVEQLTPAQAVVNFPQADIDSLLGITTSIQTAVTAGDQADASSKATDLETAWDERKSRLEPMDETAWTFLDSEIDHVLESVRASTPDVATEQAALNSLNASLDG